MPFIPWVFHADVVGIPELPDFFASHLSRTGISG